MGKLVAVLYGAYFLLKCYFVYRIHYTEMSFLDNVAALFIPLILGAAGSGIKLIIVASLAIDIWILESLWQGFWSEAREGLRYYALLLLFVLFAEPIIDYVTVDVTAVAASEAADQFMLTLGRFGRFTLLIFYAFLYGGLYLATFIGEALNHARRDD